MRIGWLQRSMNLTRAITLAATSPTWTCRSRISSPSVFMIRFQPRYSIDGVRSWMRWTKTNDAGRVIDEPRPTPTQAMDLIGSGKRRSQRSSRIKSDVTTASDTICSPGPSCQTTFICSQRSATAFRFRRSSNRGKHGPRGEPTSGSRGRGRSGTGTITIDTSGTRSTLPTAFVIST